MDDSALEVDVLAAIITSGLGTDEEMTLLKNLRENDKTTPFEKPDEFVWNLHHIPFVQERLKCWLFQRQFPDSTWDITQPLSNLKSACIEFRISDAIPSILSLALTCGNYLNGGTPRGQADGFHYEILEKLADTRSGDNKVSLVTFIVRILCEREPNLHKQLPSVETMEEAQKVPFADLQAAMREQQKKIRDHKVLLQKALDSGQNLGPAFMDNVPKFLAAAEETMEAIEAIYNETEVYYNELLIYLGNSEADAKKIKSEEFFRSMMRFLRIFKQEWDLEEKLKEKRIYERQLARRAAEGQGQTKKFLDEEREQKQSQLKKRFAKFKKPAAVAVGVADKAPGSPAAAPKEKTPKTIKRPKKSPAAAPASGGATKTCPQCSRELPAACGFCTGCGSKQN